MVGNGRYKITLFNLNCMKNTLSRSFVTLYDSYIFNEVNLGVCFFKLFVV